VFVTTVVAATRPAKLARLLETLARMARPPGVEHEVIVGNNASEDGAAASIRAVAAEFAGEALRVEHVRQPLPGKSRTLNLAIGRTRGSVIAILDDDVQVAPEWLVGVCRFFETQPFDAMQGAVLAPPEVRDDETFKRLYRRYRTIPLIDYGPRVLPLKTLTGANIAVRKKVFARVGPFNENLGPGRSGMSEDVEFAERLLRAGFRIGYEPNAVVYHEVDWSRFSEEFFRRRHEAQGRSRLVYKKQSIPGILLDLARSVCGLAWYSLAGNERKKYRAKGRYYHYRAMLREKATRGRERKP
jgi:GT2 family glycosyltransferase